MAEPGRSTQAAPEKACRPSIGRQLRCFGRDLRSAVIALRLASIGLPQVWYRLGYRFQPADEQLLAADHQSSELVVPPVTDDEPTVFPVPDCGWPGSALPEAQQATIFLFYSLGAHRESKAQPT